MMSQFQVLVAPVVALMGLAFLFNVVLRNFRYTSHEQIAFGVLFGAVVVLGMTNPLSLGEGLIFDTRTLLVGAAVGFVGPLAGFIALVAGIVCRMMIGGAGTAAGLVGLLLAYGLAIGWSMLIKDRVRNRVLHDFLFGLAISPSVIAFFVLPYELAISLFVSVLPTLLIVNTVGMVLIGFVFRREVKHFEYTQSLVDYAKTDSLTNLLNRRGMDAEFDAATFDPHCGHAMFYFDIDNFKYVNDTYGHGAGDKALAIVAARIKESIRDEAIFTRHGGDEFTIYLPRLDASDVRCVADRLCAAISDQAFTFDGTSFEVSISVGVYWSKESLSVQSMIDRADTQLLLAKQAGKNRAQIAFDNLGDVSAVA